MMSDSIWMMLILSRCYRLIKKSPQLAALSFTIAKVQHFSEKHLTNFADY